MAKFATHMGDPHCDPQTNPRHANPHGFLVGLFVERPQVHVDRRVVGWSAGRHVDHLCRWQISPWPARKVTDNFSELFTGLQIQTLMNWELSMGYRYRLGLINSAINYQLQIGDRERDGENVTGGGELTPKVVLGKLGLLTPN